MAKNIESKQTVLNSTNTEEDIIDNRNNVSFKLNSNFTTFTPNHKCRNNRYDKGAETKGPLTVFHLSIRGIKNKINELDLSMPDATPHIICITEHHLNDYETDNTHLSRYKLAAKYCRTKLKHGGVSIYIHET